MHYWGNRYNYNLCILLPTHSRSGLDQIGDACKRASASLCVRARGQSVSGTASKTQGGLTSLVVPGVQLLYPQLAQALGELQFLTGHAVPEEHHVLWADLTLGADDREEALQGHVGAHAHHRLLRAQVIHH